VLEAFHRVLVVGGLLLVCMSPPTLASLRAVVEETLSLPKNICGGSRALGERV